MFRLLATGKWQQPQVHCTWAGSTYAPPPQVQMLVDEEWERWASRPGVHLFDGPMCRLESFHTTDDRLDLTLSHTSYKQFLGTNMSHPEVADQFGQTSLARPVGLSSAVVCAGGELVLGRRNQSVAYYPNRIHPFAGALEPSENVDVFDEARRELAEEIALMPAQIVSMELCAVAEDQALRQPELIFLVHTSRQRTEMERNLDQAEHHGMVWIEPNGQAAKAILASDHLTPIARATITLWVQSMQQRQSV